MLENNLIAQNKNIFTTTATGEELLGKLWAIVENSEEKILAGFSEEEKTQLKDFIKRIQHNCEE